MTDTKTYIRFDGRLWEDMTFDPRPGWETEWIASSPPEADGPYRIELLADGDPVVSVSPAVEFDTGCAPTERREMASARIVAYLPFNPDADRLVFRREGAVIYERKIPSKPPTIEIEGVERGDEAVTVAWAAEAHGDVDLTFVVAYVADGKRAIPLARDHEGDRFTVDTSDLPGAEAAHVAVLATDGIRSSFAVSEPFAVDPKPPRVWIQRPDEGEVVPFGHPVSLVGQATDVTGHSLDDGALRWFVDDEPVASGTRTAAATDLAPGDHAVELRYAGDDRDGAARAALTFSVAEPAKARREYDAAMDRLDEALQGENV
ncbi:MAG: Ig-like domain-containing protein [Haloferacaceae archaeon]